MSNQPIPSSQEIAHLLQQYDLAAIQQVEAVKAGFLSQNYIVHTNDTSYFLKQYRFNKEQRVAAAHEAKFFFAQANIPVILPVRTRDGATFFNFSEKYYALFPFVEGRHVVRGCFSPQAIESSAHMLASIHQAGRAAKPAFVRSSQSSRNDEAFLAQAASIMRKIPQNEPTAFDSLATRCIDLKLALAKQHAAEFASIDLVSDHLLHGDYQDANLFFDPQDRVSHVFDWEKTEVAPRGLELVRAIEFICFGNPDNYKAIFSAENYERSRLFLQAYHAHYPIRLAEFANAFHVRYLHKMVSLWVEEEHYLENNRRVDRFLEAEYNTLKFFAEHFAEHLQRMSEGIIQ